MSFKRKSPPPTSPNLGAITSREAGLASSTSIPNNMIDDGTHPNPSVSRRVTMSPAEQRSQRPKRGGLQEEQHDGIALSSDRKEISGRAWWTEQLQLAGWKFFRAGIQDYRFVPSQYIRKDANGKLKHTHSQIKKVGTRGVHYAEGYAELADLVEKYAEFEEGARHPETHEKIILNFKGPDLPGDDSHDAGISETASGSNLNNGSAPRDLVDTRRAKDACISESSSNSDNGSARGTGKAESIPFTRKVPMTPGNQQVTRVQQARRAGKQEQYNPAFSIDSKVNSGRAWWSEHLKPGGWESCSAKLHDFGFIPAQHVAKDVNGKPKHTHSQVKRLGKKGAHYAEGYVELADMVEKYAEFEEGARHPDTGEKIILNFKGPDLPEDDSLDAINETEPNTIIPEDSQDAINETEPDTIMQDDSQDAINETEPDTIYQRLFRIFTTRSMLQRPRGSHPPSDHEDPGLSADSAQNGGTSGTIATQENGPMKDFANPCFQVAQQIGSKDTCESICSLVAPTDWEVGNRMPYQYLEGEMRKKANNIFVGFLRDEVCSIFSYHDSGRGLRDATVSLLWTKSVHRRKGFAKEVMNAGIEFILNTASMHSGTNPTRQSQGLYENLNFQRNNVGYSIGVEKLRKTLEQRARNQSQLTDAEWATNIHLWDVLEDDNLSDQLKDERNKWRQTQKEPEEIDLTAADDSATVDILFISGLENRQSELRTVEAAPNHSQGAISADPSGAAAVDTAGKPIVPDLHDLEVLCGINENDQYPNDRTDHLEKLLLEDIPDEQWGYRKRVDWLKKSAADICERMKVLEVLFGTIHNEQCVLQDRFNQLEIEILREKIPEDQKGSFTKRLLRLERLK